MLDDGLCLIEGFLFQISIAIIGIHKTFFRSKTEHTKLRNIASSAVHHLFLLGKRELGHKFDLNSFAQREI